MAQIAKYIQENSYEIYQEPYMDWETDTVKYKKSKGTTFASVNIVFKLNNWSFIFEDHEDFNIKQLSVWENGKKQSYIIPYGLYFTVKYTNLKQIWI